MKATERLESAASEDVEQRFCEKPDRDVGGLVCGYPKPCPHHTHIIDIANQAIMLAPDVHPCEARGIAIALDALVPILSD